MRIQLLSDIHLEHLGRPDAFLPDILKYIQDPDVLVLAGDIYALSPFSDLLTIMEGFSQTCKYLLYVPGNHEYYDSNGLTSFNGEDLEKRVPNLFFLDNKVVDLEGQRFIGSTMWFDHTLNNVLLFKHMLNDYRLIPKFDSQIGVVEQEATNFLYQNVREGDVVITHHLPSTACVAKQYQNDSLNCFYVKDMEYLIQSRKPKYWLHGHTHEMVDIKIGQTSVKASPLDYPRFWGSDPNHEKRLSCVFDL